MVLPGDARLRSRAGPGAGSHLFTQIPAAGGQSSVIPYGDCDLRAATTTTTITSTNTTPAMSHPCPGPRLLAPFWCRATPPTGTRGAPHGCPRPRLVMLLRCRSDGRARSAPGQSRMVMVTPPGSASAPGPRTIGVVVGDPPPPRTDGRLYGDWALRAAATSQITSPAALAMSHPMPEPVPPCSPLSPLVSTKWSRK